MKEDGPKRYICQVMCSISLLDSLLYPCIFSFLTYLPNNLITTFINDLMIHVHDRIVFIRMNLRVNTSPKHFLSALWEYPCEKFKLSPNMHTFEWNMLMLIHALSFTLQVLTISSCTFLNYKLCYLIYTMLYS